MALLFSYSVWVGHSFPPKEQASFHFMAIVTIHSDFGVQENKTCHWFHFFSFYLFKVMAVDAIILVFLMLSFKPAFSLSSFSSSKGSLVPLCLLLLECYPVYIWGWWYFSWQSWFQFVFHPAWHFIFSKIVSPNSEFFLLKISISSASNGKLRSHCYIILKNLLKNNLKNKSVEK